MAREERRREDLMREATALKWRAEFPPLENEEAEPITIGFRSDGAASFYFGDDPVYHFNAKGQLRRAYAAGKLYKAERGKLVSLTRNRTETETQLVRHELMEEETARMLEETARRMNALRAALAKPEYRPLREHRPAGEAEPITAALRVWLQATPSPLAVADSL